MSDLSDFDLDVLAEGFAPQSADDANRLLWHLRRATEKIAAAQALYDAENARLGAWLEERTARPLALIASLEWALDGWARMVHAADPKRKTWDLPNGVIRLRAARPTVEIADQAAFVTWAIENDALGLLNLSPAKSLIAQLPHKVDVETEDCTVEAFYVEGEPVPGCALVTAKAPNVTVKVAGDGK